MKVTVLMPVYNERWTLREIMRRVYEQSGLLHEVAAVDDGSKDGSTARLSRPAWRPCWARNSRYYGVSGNSRSLSHYQHWARRLVYKWLDRRSQRRSYSWARLERYPAAL